MVKYLGHSQLKQSTTSSPIEQNCPKPKAIIEHVYHLMRETEALETGQRDENSGVCYCLMERNDGDIFFGKIYYV